MGKIITVDFRGNQLFGFETDAGVFVALKPIVEAIGIDWSSQVKRVKRDPILSEGMVIMTTPFSRGGVQECLCLRLELVNGWLFTIDSNRIRNEAVRERVLMYQRDCYGVLAAHFLGVAAPAASEADEKTEPSSTRVRLVTETRKSFGCKQAQELWFKLGLPIVPSMLETEAQCDFFREARMKTIDHGSG